MIAAELTPAHDPGAGALDHPSSGLGSKAWREVLLPIDLFALLDQPSPFGNGPCRDGLDGPSQRDPGPRAAGATVVAVSPEPPTTGKPLLQWLSQREPSSLSGLLGSRHGDLQPVALSSNPPVTFPAPRFSSQIVALCWTANGTGCDRWALHEGRTWLCVSALLAPHCMRRLRKIRSPTPSRGHARKEAETVPHAGHSWGCMRQGHPRCQTERMALTLARRAWT